MRRQFILTHKRTILTRYVNSTCCAMAARKDSGAFYEGLGDVRARVLERNRVDPRALSASRPFTPRELPRALNLAATTRPDTASVSPTRLLTCSLAHSLSLLLSCIESGERSSWRIFLSRQTRAPRQQLASLHSRQSNAHPRHHQHPAHYLTDG